MTLDRERVALEAKTSSFHVVGTIFDRVWIEGNPGNQFRGMQTILLGSSNSVAVEFVIPEDGSYIMVDHHFANASQGAMGLISTAARVDGTEISHRLARSGVIDLGVPRPRGEAGRRGRSSLL